MVANADLVDGEERRQDRRLGLEDAVKIAVAWKAVGACSADKKGGDGGRLSPSPTIVDVSTVAAFQLRAHSHTTLSDLDTTPRGLYAFIVSAAPFFISGQAFPCYVLLLICNVSRTRLPGNLSGTPITSSSTYRPR